MNTLGAANCTSGKTKIGISVFLGENERNIILWMDHRAASQAAFINSKKPDVLKYVGGVISLEMETPKLMWLKENIPETWKSAKYFFDLADFLTWRATDDDSRYLSSN